MKKTSFRVQLSHMAQSTMLMQVPLTFIIWIATRFYFDLQRQMR
jgi:hypothetical protein